MPRIEPFTPRRKFLIGDQVYRYVPNSCAWEGPYHVSQYLDEHQYGLCCIDGSELSEPRVSEHNLKILEHAQAGGIDTIDQSIERLRRVLTTATHNRSDRATMLNNLGTWLGRRHEKNGSFEDMKNAVEAFREASENTSPDDPDHVTILGSLGSWLGSMYEVTGSMADLNGAIDILKAVIDNNSAEKSTQARRLSNLGNAIGIRFERTRALSDLNEAIKLSEKALDLVSQNDPTRAAILSNLSGLLYNQYTTTGSADDIDRATYLATTALQLTPESQSYRMHYIKRFQFLSRRFSTTSTIEPLAHLSMETVDEEDTTTNTSVVDTILSQNPALTHSSHTTQVLSGPEPVSKEAVSANIKTERLTLWLDEVQLQERDITTLAESTAAPEQSQPPVPMTGLIASALEVPELVSGRSILEWKEVAQARANAILDQSPRSNHSLSLSEVVRDRVWPFYSNWLHEPLGPCARTAEFDRNEDGDVLSVKIYITCKSLPHDCLQNIIKECTLSLFPREFNRDQVIVDIDEGTSSPSTPASVKVERIEVRSEPVDLKMGDGITSPVRGRSNQKGDLGSSGPWLRTTDSNVLLYTNEHVVRPGMEVCERTVVTHPERCAIGEVVLTSAKPLANLTEGHEKEAYPTMECHNREVHEDVRNGNNWLTDWAIVKFTQAPTKPIELMVTEDGKLCHHVNRIIHVPLKGYARAIGAGSGHQLWHAVYTAQLDGCGIPTQLSPGMWDNNSIELACWSLSRYKKASYSNLDWYNHGIGIPGDSGAGVVDSASGDLCGLIIGETRRKRGNYRTAHIIDMKDVLIDTMRAAEVDSAGLNFDGADLIQCACSTDQVDTSDRKADRRLIRIRAI